MGFDLYSTAGAPVEQQVLHWRDMAQTPISKLDDEACARVRVVLMSALEGLALRFAHAAGLAEPALREPLARLRRVELQQALAVQSMLGADHSALELAVAYKQCGIEVGAALARCEAGSALGTALRFILLDDVDHLYRLAAALDHVEGKDANNILQSHTDIVCARPTILQHRAAQDDLRDAAAAASLTPRARVHLMVAMACAQGAGELLLRDAARQADPVLRQLYAEIASVEEQHLSHLESLLDARSGWLSQWLLLQSAEALCYHACLRHESAPRLKAWWERMLDFEIGQFHEVARLLLGHQGLDARAVLPGELDDCLDFCSQRAFIQQVLAQELDRSCMAGAYVPRSQESQATRDWRAALNAEGSPSESVAAGYSWFPGTELARLQPGVV